MRVVIGWLLLLGAAGGAFLWHQDWIARAEAPDPDVYELVLHPDHPRLAADPVPVEPAQQSPQPSRSRAAPPGTRSAGDAHRTDEWTDAPAGGERGGGSPAFRTVRLGPGETIYRLCVRVLGDGRRFREVLRLNGLDEDRARRLPVGYPLRVPRR